MKLENEFTVPVPIDEAWKVLLDVERVAPCMPGATLLTVDGDSFTGTVKVKVGPIQVTYKGSATFATKDDSAHRAVIEASGKEARGSGTAAATVTTLLVDAGGTTRVKVETDLNVTGRPAQFGRGVMSEVAGKLVDQFASCLAEELAGGTPAEQAAAPSASTSTTETPAAQPPDASPPPRKRAASPSTTAPLPAADVETPRPAPEPQPAPRRSAEAIDLLDVAGASVAKRLAPVAIDLLDVAGASVAKRLAPVAVVVLLLLVFWRRRHRR